MSEQEELELIESHVLGQLSELESFRVEERIRNDDAFKNLYEETRKLILGVRHTSRKDLQQFLESVDQRNFEESGPQKTTFYSRLMIAASVVLLLSFGTFWLVNQKNPSLNKLVFEEYYTTFPNQVIPTTRSLEPPKDSKENAYYQYDLENYKIAIQQLKQIPKIEDDYSSLLYIGICYLELKKPDDAILYFKEYLIANSTFEDDAQWYLFLAYVLNNQQELARNAANSMNAGNPHIDATFEIIGKVF